MTAVHNMSSWLGALALTTIAAAQSTGSAKQPATSRPAIGRVVDVLGEPIPAAAVQLIVNDNVVHTAYADGEGVYLIPNMPKRGAHLHIGAKGKAWAHLQWQGPRTKRVRNVTLLDAGKVHGRVTNTAGEPVAGIDVIAVFGKNSQRTETDVNGGYVLDSLPVGRLTVNVWGDASRTQVAVHVRSDTECNLRIPATKAICRQVRVRGLPDAFEGASVSVINSNVILMRDGGHFPMAPDGTATVVFHETALVSPLIEGFSITPLGRFATLGNTPLEFEARPTTANSNMTEVFGTVRTVNRDAIREQQLFFHNHSLELLGTAKLDRRGKFRAKVLTSSTGQYRVGMSLEKWEFIDDRRTLHDGFSWVTVDSSDEIDLLAQATGDLNCHVQDARGTSLAFAEVTIADPANPHSVMMSSACDHSGQLHLALPAQSYQLLAVTHDGIVCYGETDIQRGRENVVNWHTVPTGSASGILVDAASKPMPGVELLFATRNIADSEELRAAERQKVRVVTNRHGRFRCRGLPLGDWTVVVINHPEFATTELKVEADKTIDLQIKQAN